MKSYLIDELSRGQVEQLVQSLHAQGYKSPIDGLFWLPVPEHLLTEEQKEHHQGCGPYIMSLETGKTWIKLELLVRSTETIRCTCIAYANKEQQAYALEWLDTLMENMESPSEPSA